MVNTCSVLTEMYVQKRYKIPIKNSDLKETQPSLQNLIHCAVTIVLHRDSSSDTKWYTFFCYHEPCTHTEQGHWLQTER